MRYDVDELPLIHIEFSTGAEEQAPLTRSPEPILAPSNFNASSSFASNSANLDLIRSVAVLSVFFAHLHYLINGGRRTWLGEHFAQMGVLIFFVHTSMVLMLSLERARLEGKALFVSFYVRRLFRIFPLAMFCVTAAMLLCRAPDVMNPVRHWSLTQYLANLSLTTNLTMTETMVGGLWTLPIEVQMYAALPFLFVIGRSRLRGALYLVCIVWMFSIPVAIMQLHTTARLSVLAFAPCFIAGVIAWKLSHSVKRHLAGSLWPFGFIATWPVFLLATDAGMMYFRWVYCLVLAIAMPWFQEISHRPIKIVTQTIAKYSYGIYLTHWAIIMWCFALPISTAIKWGTFVLLATIAPVAAYHLIEHPLVRVGHCIAEALLKKSANATNATKAADSHLSIETPGDSLDDRRGRSEPVHVQRCTSPISCQTRVTDTGGSDKTARDAGRET
jgi:peptidoglycan/LPS O-acetylase OafA/YrhL